MQKTKYLEARGINSANHIYKLHTQVIRECGIDQNVSTQFANKYRAGELKMGITMLWHEWSDHIRDGARRLLGGSVP